MFFLVTKRLHSTLFRSGRTGRFGRRGVSINFVHDKRSWDQMHAIEEALHKPIVRVNAKDMDEMEKVSSTLSAL